MKIPVRTPGMKTTVRILVNQMCLAVRLYQDDPEYRQRVLDDAKRVTRAELRDEPIRPVKGIV